MYSINKKLSLFKQTTFKVMLLIACLVCALIISQQANAQTNNPAQAKATKTERVWFITGGNRGLGAAIAKAALNNGDKVVATARNPATAHKTLGNSDRLLVVQLDVTNTEQIKQAVAEAINKFGRIDVLVNNAGYGQYGFFEEISDEAIRRQFDVNVFGAMNVTRAVLPQMRKQQTGYIVTMSSIAGVTGRAGCTVYCASKFAVEGWMESLNGELKPFGIHAMLIEPGAFRTDFLDASSVRYGEHTIADYKKLPSDQQLFEKFNHKQGGDPTKLAQAIITLLNSDNPPLRFIAGKDAVERAEQGLFEKRQQELNTWRNLSTSLGFDNN